MKKTVSAKVTATRHLVEQVDEALAKYGCDVLSVDLNEESGKIDINQCHHSWSDVIFSGVIPAASLDKRVLIPALNKRHVGYCL